MIYRRDKSKGFLKRIIPLLILVSVVALGIYGKNFLSRLGNSTQNSLALVSESKDNIGGFFNGLSAAVSFKRSLSEENRRLKAEQAGFRALALERDRLAEENTELKDALGRKSEKKSVLAAIIAKPNRSPYDTIVIDTGTDSGVISGARVLTYGGTVVGEVADVGTATSKVELFSSPGKITEGLIMGSNISISLRGMGGGNFEATLPRDVEIPVGAQVVSAGINPFLIAVVGAVVNDPRNPFEVILLKTPFNIQDLKLVEVLVLNN
jgi:rod shape-determining protein MreC